MEAATLLHFFPASRHHSSYLPWWQRMPPQAPDIRREQGRNNYQSLYSHVTTHSKGLRPSSLTNFSTYWVVMPKWNWYFQLIKFSGVRCLSQLVSDNFNLRSDVPKESLFIWLLLKNSPSLFLDNLIQRKGSLSFTELFLFFFSLQSLHKYK